jgi:tetratricopeptide (TPR) repeat protein
MHARLVAGAGAGLLAVLAYANTLGHGFVWDDPISLERWLPALPTAWSAFFPPANIPQFPPDYYRPLQLLSYRLDRSIGGGAPWPFHLSVVLLHAVATVLVFASGLKLLERSAAGWWVAFWAATVFAVHPIHSESVAWMAARPDVMVTVAGLGALLAFWRTDWTEWRRSLTAAALIFVALLCKENAAALLILVPLSTAILAPRRPRTVAPRDVKRRGNAVRPLARPSPAALLPFVAVGLAYLLMRSVALGRVLPEAGAGTSNLPSALAIALGTYLRLLIVPYPQNAYISDLPGGAASLGNLLAVFGCAALLGWAWRRGDRPLSFALLWILLALAPSLVLVADPNTAPLAERYLYLPSVGFCWAAGILLARVLDEKSGLRLVAHAGAAALVVAGLALTVHRNRVWQDNHALWSDTAEKSPADGLPLRNLATATLAGGDAAEAERLFHAALERRNDAHGRYTIFNNLGTLALDRNDDAAAERYYRMAYALRPTADCLYNLGLIALGRALRSELPADAAARETLLREARGSFEQAVAASPHDPDIHVALGQAAEALGDAPAARRHFEEALRLGLPPSTADAVRRRLESLESTDAACWGPAQLRLRASESRRRMVGNRHVRREAARSAAAARCRRPGRHRRTALRQRRAERRWPDVGSRRLPGARACKAFANGARREAPCLSRRRRPGRAGVREPPVVRSHPSAARRARPVLP